MKRIFELLVSAAFTLFAVALLCFLLMKIVPGGPFTGDKALPPEVLQALEAKFRLNLPAHEQFFLYIKDILLHFDFGPSIKYPDRSVKEIIFDSLPVSLELGFYALIISLVSGLALGLLAAVYRGRWIDTLAMEIAVVGVSVPSFLAGAVAILIFSQHLNWLPAALWDEPTSKILPSVVLGLRPTALLARMLRSSVLEVLGQDFVRTAKAKGLAYHKILFVHVLKNSLLPVLTILGPLAATLLTGSFIIEYIFSIPGLAGHFITAVTNRDYPLVMGVTLLYATFLVAANLIVDILYGVVDPRVRQESK